MKAAVHTRYDPPEVVRIADIDRPTAGNHAGPVSMMPLLPAAP